MIGSESRRQDFPSRSPVRRYVMWVFPKVSVAVPGFSVRYHPDDDVDGIRLRTEAWDDTVSRQRPLMNAY